MFWYIWNTTDVWSKRGRANKKSFFSCSHFSTKVEEGTPYARHIPWASNLRAHFSVVHWQESTKFLKFRKSIALIRWHQMVFTKPMIALTRYHTICLVKVINPNWINLICHGKASNQAGKKQHLLFQCKLNVLGLHIIKDQTWCIISISITNVVAKWTVTLEYTFRKPCCSPSYSTRATGKPFFFNAR